MKNNGKVVNLFDRIKHSNKKTIVERQLKLTNNATLSIVEGDPGSVRERGSCYMMYTKKKWIQISNFIIEPISVISTGGDSQIFIKLKNEDGKEIMKQFETTIFGKVSKFEELVNGEGIDFWFKGNKVALTGIKSIVSQKYYNEVISVDKLGFFSHENKNYFVTAEKVVDQNGEDDGLLKFSGRNPISTTLLDYEVISKKDLKELVKHLFKFNSPLVTVPIIAFAASCFLKDALFKEGFSFLHLIVTGQAGSGKSQTINFVLKNFFGIKAERNVDMITSAALQELTMNSNVLPLILEEYKPSKMSKSQRNLISGILRVAYGETPSSKWGEGGKVVDRMPTTPIVLVGEMSVNENAVLERSIQVYFSKKESLAEHRTEHFEYLKGHGAHITKLGRLLVNKVLEKTKLMELKLAKSRWNVKADPKMESRMTNTISNLMMGIELLNEVLSDHELSLKELTGYDLDDMFKYIENAIILNNLGDGQKGKSIVENTLMIIDEMAEAGIIDKDLHYQVVNESFLAIKIKDVYPKLKPYIKSQNMMDFELLDRREFEKQAVLMGIGIANQAVRFRKDFEKPVSKAFKIDLKSSSLGVKLENLVS